MTDFERRMRWDKLLISNPSQVVKEYDELDKIRYNFTLEDMRYRIIALTKLDIKTLKERICYK